MSSTLSEVIKLFFMLNSSKKEICSAYNKLNTSNLDFFLHGRTEHEIFPANKY